ncbi:MAG: CHC2 zinc finger domain-containing protein [Candidatus Bipolaricaulota bacterium]|nr:CHC2 zinc finger domain-containing protein [Candidatus Bipolaricaulota bacterium]
MALRQDVQAIKARIDLVSVVSRYVTLTKSGSGHKGRCPFHKDDSPSFMVSWSTARRDSGIASAAVREAMSSGF